MGPTAVVSRRGADRVRTGHPWVYRSDVISVAAEPGDLVCVSNDRDRHVGWAFFSSVSQITLRFVSTARRVPDERTLIGSRLAEAAAYRRSLDIDATAYRLLNGEADRLPATVVDRYADDTGSWFVVQTLSEASDRRLALLCELLIEQFEPQGILARNDPKVRRLEGLPEQVEVLYGDVPDRVMVREGVVRYAADLRHGQKTGLFLDQRENHAAAARYTHGATLDAFTYNGGFALQMAARARSVLALDASESAVASTRANAAANGVTNVEVRVANVFDELRELEIAGASFDTIVLDPPAFAKNRDAIERAIAGYKEINLRALRILSPGGHLITCSCSYNLDEAVFLHTVQQAAIDAHATIALVEKRMQARDHPVLLGVPETYYLKCLIVRKLA
ncbi:MAG: class I SAM-dependent rRNA methyltransferase [Vicinamibacterales bacterium]